MRNHANAQNAIGTHSIYASRKAILRVCTHADVSDLLDLADDLYGLIRARWAQARYGVGSTISGAMHMTRAAVFLD